LVPAQSLIHQETIAVPMQGRGSTEISERIAEIVANSDVQTGLVHVFIMHTSASLMICEDADPEVREDLERFFSDLVHDGDERFRHRSEGADDMSAHVRSILTQTDLTIPVAEGRLALGTWQGIFVWEHRYRAYDRRVVVTVTGRSRATSRATT